MADGLAAHLRRRTGFRVQVGHGVDARHPRLPRTTTRSTAAITMASSRSGSVYAFTENFVLPLSHDEVVHGKGSLLGRMPGDDWQQRANLRLLLGYQWTTPGKKLLFMGGEFGQWREWDHEGQLDWSLLELPEHAGIARWVGDLNQLLRTGAGPARPRLRPAGFEWIDADDCRAQRHRLPAPRRARPTTTVLVVANFTPVSWRNHRIGVPDEGGGSNGSTATPRSTAAAGRATCGGVEATPVAAHGRPWSVNLTVPPLGIVILRPAP